MHTINASQISGGLDDDLRILYDSATADTATFNITGNTFSALQSTATANGLINLFTTTAASAASNVTFKSAA